MSINRAHTLSTIFLRTTAEISLETPQFMKHKCVFPKGTYFLETTGGTVLIVCEIIYRRRWVYGAASIVGDAYRARKANR